MVSNIVQHLKSRLLNDQVRFVLVQVMPLMQRQYHEDTRQEIIALIPALENAGEDCAMPSVTGSVDDLFFEVCRLVENVMSVSSIHVVSTRKHEEVMARQVVIFCMCEELHRIGRMTYRQLSNCFDGSVHHATIIYARRKVLDLIGCDPRLHRQLKIIGEQLAAAGYSRVLDTVMNVRILNRNI